MAAKKPHGRKLRRATDIARFHRRLLISIAFGTVLITVPFDVPLYTKLLIAWNGTAALYLALSIAMMMRADLDAVRKRAQLQDEGAWIILAITVAAALASLAAVFLELSAAKANAAQYGLHAGLAVTTIVLSWFFIHVIFALHYAHEFYHVGARGSGLEFPGKEPPIYEDFLYFSIVIGMTFQVSDVSITERKVRRTALAHSILSFMFNATIIALTVNIAAGII